MRQKVFVQRVESKEDMSVLESTIGSLLGGEKNKCSLIRCSEFVQLRLRALYGRGKAPVHVYGEGLQISLDPDNLATVYLLTSYVEADEGLLGKRSQPEDEEMQVPAALSSAPDEDENEEEQVRPALSSAPEEGGAKHACKDDESCIKEVVS